MKTNTEKINKKTAQMRVIIYKTKKPELVNYMKKQLKDIRIEEVRSRLSKVKGSLAEDIIKHRE